MAAIVRFVASVGSTTARLDLSPGIATNGGMQIGGGSGRLDDGVDFGRPKLTPVTAAGALTDGDPYVASSYGNVRFTLPIVLPNQSTMDARQAALRALAVELDRPTNVLYVQADGATAGRWLVTYRHTDAGNWLRLASQFKLGTVDVTLDRHPFAYGPATSVTLGAPSGDPEQNTWTYTVAAVNGDVDAPMTLTAYVTSGPAGVPPQKFYVAAKAREWTDATGGLKYHLAAPDAAISNVASTAVSGAAGASGTAYRWTPASGAEAYIFGGFVPDFVTPPSPAAARELSGRWRILARMRRSTAGDVFRVRARVRAGTTGSNTGALLWPNLITVGGTGGWTYVDLGIMQNPVNALPVGTDPWGDPPAVMTQAVEVYGTRVSGSGTLDVDHLLALPADGRTVIADLGGNTVNTVGDAFVVDGDRNVAYVVRDYSGVRYIRSGLAPVGFDGGALRVSPRWTTLVSVVPDAGDPGVTTSTLNLVGSYRPRYLDAL